MPAALEGLLMVLLSSVDIIMVGTLGTTAIAAVSIFTQPRMMLLCISRSFSAVLALLTAQYFGMGRKAEVGTLLRQSVFLSVVVFGILHLAFFCSLKMILAWMGAEPSYMESALDYGEIALFAVFLTSLTGVLQAVLLGFGQTAAVLFTNLQGNAVNIIVNALLIFGLGPFPAMGVKGAAIGTVAGTCYTLIHTFCRLRQDGVFRRGTVLPDRAYFSAFLPLFGGVFSEQGFERIGMVLYTRMVAELGTLPYAVHAICMNFCDFYYCFAGGLGKASMVLAGQSHGSGNHRKWQCFRNTGMKWGFIFSFLSFAVTFLFRDDIFSIYSNDAEALALGSAIMILVAAVSFPEAHAMICAGVLRGSGKTTQVALYSLVSIAVIRPIVTAILLYQFGLGLMGAWIALAIDQGMRASCAYFLLRNTHSYK